MKLVPIIILFAMSPNRAVSQNTFNSIANQLCFGVDLSKRTMLLIDSFKAQPRLKFNDTVMRQWNLNGQISKNPKENVERARYTFDFYESPLSEQPLQSGKVIITTAESRKIKELLSLEWNATFPTSEAAKSFYDKLNEMFGAVTTIRQSHQLDGVKSNIQYSAENAAEIGIKQISIFQYDSDQPNKSQVKVFLFYKNKIE